MENRGSLIKERYIGEARRDKFIEVFGRFEQFEELWLIIFKKILSFCKKGLQKKSDDMLS